MDNIFILYTGNMAAFDLDDPKSIVSPGGVGFDINCGVRLLRTNLFEHEILPIKVLNCNLYFHFIRALNYTYVQYCI